MARTLDTNARVMVFIDGQNAAKTTQALYGNLHSHPLLLAHQLLAGRKLCGVRYYSGIHEPRVNPGLNSLVSRRHWLMRKVGVTVIERQLRYRWEWGLDQRQLPDARKHRGETRAVEIQPYQRAREKGIDLALGLDVVDLALEGKMDVAVIVSSDTDLTEVARAVHSMTIRNKRVSVEAALFTNKHILLKDYDYTQNLGAAEYDECRDSFNYREALDPVMVQIFQNACAALQPERA